MSLEILNPESKVGTLRNPKTFESGKFCRVNECKRFSLESTPFCASDILTLRKIVDPAIESNSKS